MSKKGKNGKHLTAKEEKAAQIESNQSRDRKALQHKLHMSMQQEALENTSKGNNQVPTAGEGIDEDIVGKIKGSAKKAKEDMADKNAQAAKNTKGLITVIGRLQLTKKKKRSKGKSLGF